LGDEAREDFEREAEDCRRAATREVTGEVTVEGVGALESFEFATIERFDWGAVIWEEEKPWWIEVEGAFDVKGGVPTGVVDFSGKVGRGGELPMIERESLFDLGEIESVWSWGGTFAPSFHR